MSLLEVVCSATIIALVFGASLVTWQVDNRILLRAKIERSIDDQANSKAQETLRVAMGKVLQSSSTEGGVNNLVYGTQVITVQNDDQIQRIELVGYDNSPPKGH